MHSTSIIAGVLLLLVCVSADFVPLYTRTGAPANSKWTLSKRASPMTQVTFTISLYQQNVDKLIAKLYEDSDPHSPKYGQHMTLDEIMEIVAPPVEVQRKVLRWIKEAADTYGAHHLISVKNEQDAIIVRSTSTFVEKLFRTKMHVFYNKKTGDSVVKHMGSLYIPSHLSEYIEMITGITELVPTEVPFLGSGIPRKTPKPEQTGDNLCNVPYSMKNLYNIPQTLQVTNPLANQSIYAEVSAGTAEGFGIGSLADWEKANGLPQNPIKCILGTGANMFYQNDTDLEAQLDTQMMSGMAPGAKTCFYIMEYGNGWMYEFARLIMKTPEAPLVVSMSYGWFEVEQCMNFSDGVVFVGNCTSLHIPNSQVYVNRTNAEFVKLGLMGFTLLAASGDDGTAGGHQSEDNCATMGPIFPSSSPFVTSCGATSVEQSSTQLRDADAAPPICTNANYQCVCSTSTNEQPALANNTAEFDTGGGFSIHIPMQPYQKSAVSKYLTSGVQLPLKSLFNPNNRAFPDIAAVGENVCVLDPGNPCNFVGGTSAATPLIGSIVTLLNQDRFNAGKKSLGFINPIIYDMYDTAPTQYYNNHFTEGNNAGECESDHGFNAWPGWNPLTGCGSPKFDQIRKYVGNLP